MPDQWVPETGGHFRAPSVGYPLHTPGLQGADTGASKHRVPVSALCHGANGDVNGYQLLHQLHILTSHVHLKR